MKKTIRLFSILLIISTMLVYADDKDFSISVKTGADKLSGYTLYGIGWNSTDVAGNKYAIGYKISELRFPLDLYIAYADIDVVFLKNWYVRGRFGKSVFANTGTATDSDWGYWYLKGYSWASPSTLDFFSNSDSNLVNAYSIDGDALYRFGIVPGFEISAGIGFIFQYYYFDTSNLNQWCPSYDTYSANLTPQYAQHDIISGEVGTYEIKYFIPLIEINACVTLFDNLKLNVLAGYSPFVKVLDADDHILRSKLSYGDCTGMAFKCSFDGRYDFSPNFFAGGNVGLLIVDASGAQKQLLYNDTSEGSSGPKGSVDMKIGSFQFSAGVYLGLAF